MAQAAETLALRPQT